jgi:hypothetical protein
VRRPIVNEGIAPLGRILGGAALVAWSFVVIPANRGNNPYADPADLIFGYFLLLVGSVLLVSGFRADAQGAEGRPDGGGARQDSPFAREVAVEVVGGLILAALLAVIKALFQG